MSRTGRLVLQGLWVLLGSRAALAQGPDRLLQDLEARAMQASPGQLTKDVERFGTSLAAMPPAYWDSRPNEGAGSRSMFTARAVNYLNAAGRFAPAHRDLSLAVARAYRSLGEFQDPGSSFAGADSSGALLSYQNSGLFLSQFANQNASDPAVRGQLQFLGGRVRALGGRLPIWLSVPVGGGMGNSGERGIPAAYTQAPPVEEEAVLPPPMVERSGMSAEQLQLLETTLEQFRNATVSVSTAAASIAGVRRSVNSHGWSLAASYEKSLIRMRLSLEEARHLMEQKYFEQAAGMLTITEAEARKALRGLGQ